MEFPICLDAANHRPGYNSQGLENCFLVYIRWCHTNRCVITYFRNCVFEQIAFDPSPSTIVLVLSSDEELDVESPRNCLEFQFSPFTNVTDDPLVQVLPLDWSVVPSVVPKSTIVIIIQNSAIVWLCRFWDFSNIFFALEIDYIQKYLSVNDFFIQNRVSFGAIN